MLKALLALKSSSITLASTNKTRPFAQLDLLRTKKYSNPVFCKQPAFPFQGCERVTYRFWLTVFKRNNIKCSSGSKKCRLWPHINPISMVLTFDFNSGTMLGIFKSRTKWKEKLNTFFFLLKTGTIMLMSWDGWKSFMSLCLAYSVIGGNLGNLQMTAEKIPHVTQI